MADHKNNYIEVQISFNKNNYENICSELYLNGIENILEEEGALKLYFSETEKKELNHSKKYL
ncbi:MAG: hypothetical protein R3A12_05755 [Ignavibacteria bacterium]